MRLGVRLRYALIITGWFKLLHSMEINVLLDQVIRLIDSVVPKIHERYLQGKRSGDLLKLFLDSIV